MIRKIELFILFSAGVFSLFAIQQNGYGNEGALRRIKTVELFTEENVKTLLAKLNEPNVFVVENAAFGLLEGIRNDKVPSNLVPQILVELKKIAVSTLSRVYVSGGSGRMVLLLDQIKDLVLTKGLLNSKEKDIWAKYDVWVTGGEHVVQPQEYALVEAVLKAMPAELLFDYSIIISKERELTYWDIRHFDSNIIISSFSDNLLKEIVDANIFIHILYEQLGYLIYNNLDEAEQSEFERLYAASASSGYDGNSVSAQANFADIFGDYFTDTTKLLKKALTSETLRSKVKFISTLLSSEKDGKPITYIYQIEPNGDIKLKEVELGKDGLPLIPSGNIAWQWITIKGGHKEEFVPQGKEAEARLYEEMLRDYGLIVSKLTAKISDQGRVKLLQAKEKTHQDLWDSGRRLGKGDVDIQQDIDITNSHLQSKIRYSYTFPQLLGRGLLTITGMRRFFNLNPKGIYIIFASHSLTFGSGESSPEAIYLGKYEDLAKSISIDNREIVFVKKREIVGWEEVLTCHGHASESIPTYSYSVGVEIPWGREDLLKDILSKLEAFEITEEEKAQELPPTITQSIQNATWQGRTAIFDLGDGYLYALKFGWPEQPAYALEREAYMMNRVKGVLDRNKIDTSYLSVPIPNPKGNYIYRFDGSLSEPPGLKINRDMVLYYRAKKSYFEFVNQDLKQSNTYEQRLSIIREATSKAISSLAVLFKGGNVHTALSSLTHGTDSSWRWDNITDKSFTIDNLKQTLLSPNLRLGGIADFEHVEELGFKYKPHYIGTQLAEWSFVVTHAGWVNGLTDEDIQKILIEGFNQYYKILTDTNVDIISASDANGRALITFVRDLKAHLSSTEIKFYRYDNLIKVIENFVDRFESYKKQYQILITTQGGLVTPVDIAVGVRRIEPTPTSPRTYYEERIFVAGEKLIQIINEKGMIIKQFDGKENGNPGLKSISAIAYDKNKGRLWVVENGYPRISVFDIDGKFLFSTKIEGLEENQGQHFIDIDRFGNAWVVDTNNNRVQKISPEGKLLLQFGTWGKGRGEFDLPLDITVRKMEGGVEEILVVDSNNYRIQVFNSEGKFLSEFGSKGKEVGQFMSRPQRIVSREYETFVFDGLYRIQIFSRNNYLSQLGTRGTKSGLFNSIVGFDYLSHFEKRNKLYVVEKDRIQVILEY